jgi:hypothetical protein
MRSPATPVAHEKVFPIRAMEKSDRIVETLSHHPEK